MINHKTALIDVAVTSSSFNVTGGTVSNIQKVRMVTIICLTPTAPVTLAMAAGVKDAENRYLGGGTGQVVFGQGGLYRSNDLLGFEDFDEGYSNKAYNTTAGLAYCYPQQWSNLEYS